MAGTAFFLAVGARLLAGAVFLVAGAFLAGVFLLEGAALVTADGREGAARFVDTRFVPAFLGAACFFFVGTDFTRGP